MIPPHLLAIGAAALVYAVFHKPSDKGSNDHEESNHYNPFGNGTAQPSASTTKPDRGKSVAGPVENLLVDANINKHLELEADNNEEQSGSEHENGETDQQERQLADTGQERQLEENPQTVKEKESE